VASRLHTRHHLATGVPPCGQGYDFCHSSAERINTNQHRPSSSLRPSLRKPFLTSHINITHHEPKQVSSEFKSPLRHALSYTRLQVVIRLILVTGSNVTLIPSSAHASAFNFGSAFASTEAMYRRLNASARICFLVGCPEG